MSRTITMITALLLSFPLTAAAEPFTFEFVGDFDSVGFRWPGASDFRILITVDNGGDDPVGEYDMSHVLRTELESGDYRQRWDRRLGGIDSSGDADFWRISYDGRQATWRMADVLFGSVELVSAVDNQWGFATVGFSGIVGELGQFHVTFITPSVSNSNDANAVWSQEPNVFVGSLVAAVHYPPFANSGFERGNYDMWDQLAGRTGPADYQVVSNLGSIAPTEGRYMALVRGRSGFSNDWSYLSTAIFDWSAYAEVCFDIRVMFERAGDFPSSVRAFEVSGSSPPTFGPPLLAIMHFEQADYLITSAISGETQRIPYLRGGDSGIEVTTHWETLCFDTSLIDFADDDPVASLSFRLLFGELSGTGDGETFLIDRVAGVRFPDVRPDYWAFSFIDRLARSRVSRGCGGGNFCPQGIVTRAQMAVLLERGMRGGDYAPPAATGTVFSDVTANAFAAAFIEQLASDGITGGCGGGNYCPSRAVTRAQMAVFLLRAKFGAGYTPPPATGVFGDVSPGYWAAAWIETLAAEGITGGCGGGNYCPEAVVTRAQMAVFLVRTFGL